MQLCLEIIWISGRLVLLLNRSLLTHTLLCSTPAVRTASRPRCRREPSPRPPTSHSYSLRNSSPDKNQLRSWDFNFLTKAIHQTSKKGLKLSMLDCGEEAKVEVLSNVAWCSTRGTQRGVEEEVSLGSGAKNVAELWAAVAGGRGRHRRRSAPPNRESFISSMVPTEP